MRKKVNALSVENATQKQGNHLNFTTHAKSLVMNSVLFVCTTLSSLHGAYHTTSSIESTRT
jgi:hypothetical protein